MGECDPDESPEAERRGAGADEDERKGAYELGGELCRQPGSHEAMFLLFWTTECRSP